MNWTLIFVLIALVIYIVYNIVSLKMFGVPNSLSETFYLFKEKKEWMKYLFPIMMVSLVVFLMPAWLEISVGSPFQFLSFLAAAGIMFTGAAPAFLSSSMEKTVHTTGAICAAIFALLWVILVSKLWWTIPLWLVTLGLTMWVTKTIKSSYIYWLETIAFMSTFTSIIIYYFS